jgi:hypothetical protein
MTSTLQTYPAFDAMPIAGDWRPGSTGKTRPDVFTSQQWISVQHRPRRYAI